MKNLFGYVLILFFIINSCSYKVLALEKESIINKSQLIIARNYAEKYCNAKDDNFFKGLDNEKTLKNSYFKYIGLNNEEIYSKDIYELIIFQIKKTCIVTNEEEKEINQFFIKEYD